MFIMAAPGIVYKIKSDKMEPHYNPVKGKWSLAKDFVSYEHSIASFYEEGITRYFIPKHYKDLSIGFTMIQSLSRHRGFTGRIL